MVIVHLIGGLGNQMFQYALGRAVSLRLGVPLALDVGDFAHYQLHQGFELLRVFNIQASIATSDDIKHVLGFDWMPSSLFCSLRPILIRFGTKNIVREPHYHYWNGIDFVSDNKYLTGYWQSEKYFFNFEDVIRKDFDFKEPLTAENKFFANVINSCNSVSIHFRRGDYVKNHTTNSFHGVCEIEYYQRAIATILQCVENPHFFIFSDDPQWVKENFKVSVKCDYLVHNQGAHSFFDMLLMSLCKHNIIANSTFSWWAAWLNKAPGKIVIAPKKWFAQTSLKTHDLYCKNWIRL